MSHEKSIYSIIHLIGDLGGTLGIFTSLFAFLITPISSLAFYLKAFERLYLAKTNDGGMFKGQPLNKSSAFPTLYKNTVVE